MVTKWDGIAPVHCTVMQTQLDTLVYNDRTLVNRGGA